MPQMDEHGKLYSYKLFDRLFEPEQPPQKAQKSKILNVMFLLLMTENPFKVVFKVKFWLHYQILHNYKADDFKSSY